MLANCQRGLHTDSAGGVGGKFGFYLLLCQLLRPQRVLILLYSFEPHLWAILRPTTIYAL